MTSFSHVPFCVIDDDARDYEPILEALWRNGNPVVHVRGDTTESLPNSPLSGIRVVLTDLHLSSASNAKDHASHTASVFLRTIASDDYPLLVVVWSKYASETVDAGEFESPPTDDQPALSDLFIETLLHACPELNGRAFFAVMEKPKLQDRPSGEAWIEALRTELAKVVASTPGVSLLLSWQGLVTRSSLSVARELAKISQSINSDDIQDGLKTLMKVLAFEHGGKTDSPDVAVQQLNVVLTALLSDSVEHSTPEASIAEVNGWMCDGNALAEVASFASDINTVLLTAQSHDSSAPFLPGTVYRVDGPERFKEMFDRQITKFCNECYLKVPEELEKLDRSGWRDVVRPVLLEVSPSCDVHQQVRRQATLVAGLLIPAVHRIHAQASGAFMVTPSFKLRDADGNLPDESFVLQLNARFKKTLHYKENVEWLQPLFRIRELPTADIRNWFASNVARIGYTALH